MYLTFAWRYFKAKKSANAINIISWVTVGVIAFATACQVLVLSVFNGFEDLVKTLYGNFYSDIRIIPAKGKTFVLTPQIIQQIKQTYGIFTSSLVAEEKALLRLENQQTVVFLKGVDEQYASVTGITKKIVDGNFLTGDTSSPGLVVGVGIQNAASIRMEGALEASEVTLILPKKVKVSAADPLNALSEGLVKATGVFAIQQEFDNKYAITNIGFVKQQMGFEPNEYSALELKLKPGISAEPVMEKLSSLLGNGFKVQSKYQQNTVLYNTMRTEKWFIYAVLTLILIIAAFNMISALTMLVLEKQKDIQVLQSMGATRTNILKIFLSEGMLLGSIGCCTGVLLAFIICLLQIRFKLIRMDGSTFLIDYFPVKILATDMALVMFSAILIAFLASWIPANKASRQPMALK